MATPLNGAKCKGPWPGRELESIFEVIQSHPSSDPPWRYYIITDALCGGTDDRRSVNSAAVSPPLSFIRSVCHFRTMRGPNHPFVVVGVPICMG